ncbi:MAG TPA: MlaD family protein [Flavipsychrobacter sp.]|nr:MlaD family protein [Flavipsychrobacter sp.]
MKFSKEARIGLLVAVALFIFIAGFYFLKGANLFSGETEYYAYFDDVQGLQTSSGVQVKGLTVGRVVAITLNEADGKVKVLLAVGKKTKVTEGSSVKLASADLLGTKVLKLDIAKGDKELAEESVLPAIVEGSLIDNLSGEIAPLVTDIRHVVSTLDTVLLGVNNMLNQDTRQHLANSMASLDVTLKNFSALSEKLNNESNQLASVIRNANSITTNLANSNQQITNIMKNADNISGQLANAPIERTVKDLQVTIKQLNGIMAKINNNEGSLGMLVNDKALHDNLSESLKTLNALMADINAHPSRYINVTIFGRKNKNK